MNSALWLRSLPKVSLHCHLEGTLQASTFRALAQKHHVDLCARAELPDEALYRFANFYEFLMVFRDVCDVLRDPEDYALLVREYVRTAKNDGVVAAEIFVSPGVWLRMHPALDVRAVFESIAVALYEESQVDGIPVSLICDITRNFGPEQALTTVDIACSMRDLGVVGIGLGGDEANFPAELFVDAFRKAQQAGLHCVAHAGEVASAESVKIAVELLGAERIGHGVRAVEDPKLLRLLARRNIALEQSPHSNACTGAVSGVHPMQRIVDAGVRVAIDADDPAIFGKSILDEYSAAVELYGPSFILDRAYDAVAASFLSTERKRNLFSALARYADEPFPEFAAQSAKGR